MFRKLFLEHPEQVGESYAEHLGVASRFGAAMVGGGLACIVHAVVPAIFKTAGSDTVDRLHAQMVKKRRAKRDAFIDERVLNWVI